jgi:hypothetical protein
MLKSFMEKLSNELRLSLEWPSPEKKEFSLKINENIVASLRDLNPGVAMSAKIGRCPSKKKEELFIYLSRANLLGQGTGGCRIGLDVDEKTLTLSRGLPYEMNYQAFKESFEDFVNYLVYWREEVAKFEKEQHTIL